MKNEVLDQIDGLIMYLCDSVDWAESQEKIQLINALSELITARSFYDEGCYNFSSYETRKEED